MAKSSNTPVQLDLVDFIAQVHPVSNQLINYFRAHSSNRTVARNKFLLKPGQACTHYFFIRKGLVRAYMKEGNKEFTTWICREGEIVTSIHGIIYREPAQEYIHTLEHCELTLVSHDAIEYMYSHFPEMNIVGRKILEKYYSDAEERALICRIPNARKRYERFLRTQPLLANRVPLKYIASFLGMTVETLSRIR